MNNNVYEGNVCILEREAINDSVYRIKEELILGMNETYWEELQDIIYFRPIGGKVSKEWKDFLFFVSSHSEKIINIELLEDILSNLEKEGINELIIDEKFCSNIGIRLDLIKDFFVGKIVDPIRVILNKWNNSNKTRYPEDNQFNETWVVLYNELKNKSNIFINSLWEEIVEQIIIPNDLFSSITTNISGICYNYNI